MDIPTPAQVDQIKAISVASIAMDFKTKIIRSLKEGKLWEVYPMLPEHVDLYQVLEVLRPSFKAAGWKIEDKPVHQCVVLSPL